MKRQALLSLAGTGEARDVMAVALGAAHADCTVTNASVLNVYTGECLEGLTVSIKGRWIAHVGQDAGDRISHKTEVIDAGGRLLIPGFIDGHTHLADMIYRPSEFIRYAAPGGTTTVITETIEPYPICGCEGIEDFLSALKDQPITFFATVPPVASNCKRMNGIPVEDLKRLLMRDDIVGLGEAYWSSVLQEPDVFLPLIEETLKRGKKAEGHSAGASIEKLMAYCAAGVSSCHEPIKAEEVLERLRLGLHVMIREGSIRRDLEQISEIRHAGIDMRRLMLVTDGVGPTDLLENGYMEGLVQKAVDCGLDPVQAVQMATLNVAEYFNLDGLIGGLAPGRQADMLLIPDMRNIQAELVIARGRVIAEKGRLTASPRDHVFSDALRNSIHLHADMKAEDFSIRAPEGLEEVKVRVIDQVTDLVTREALVKVEVKDGEIRSDVDSDLLKAAAIDRGASPGKSFVGLIRGFRLRSGAVACSSGWDSSDIMAVGARDADMAFAVNRIRALQGGVVVCDRGVILAELPMPILGLMSELPLPDIAVRMKEVIASIQGLGCLFGDPYRTLATLAGAAIPFIRLCDEGLVSLKTGQNLPLIETAA
ncbi:MAG: adenine deaminase C-terminal domain-containing protein [Thermodesulfobacteriota bacterium]